MQLSPPSRRERGLVSPRYSSLGRGIVERVPERGLRVQPANLRGVVGREDRRATVLVAYASPGGTRLGLFPVIRWANQGTAPPAPSRHGMVPLSLWTTVIPWGERRVELARRHRSVARREPSAVTREVHHNRFTSRTRHDRVTREAVPLLGQRQDLASGQPSRGWRDSEPCHADRPGHPVGQIEQFDREPTVVVL